MKYLVFLFDYQTNLIETTDTIFWNVKKCFAIVKIEKDGAVIEVLKLKELEIGRRQSLKYT